MEGSTLPPEEVRDILLRLLEAYTSLPTLWEVSLKWHANKKIMLPAMNWSSFQKQIKKDAVREAAKNKITSLESNYREVLKEVMTQNYKVSGLMMYANQNVGLSKN
jgi:hypothetical protein